MIPKANAFPKMIPNIGISIARVPGFMIVIFMVVYLIDAQRSIWLQLSVLLNVKFTLFFELIASIVAASLPLGRTYRILVLASNVRLMQRNCLLYR